MESAFGTLVWVVRIAFLVLLYGFLFRAFASVQQALGEERVAARPAGLAVLVARSGGARHPLRAVNSIGRDPGGDVVLRDEAASTHHAVLELVAGEWWVEDAGSTNGTRVNGHPVTSRTRVRYGDELTIARTTLRLEQA